MAFGTGGFGGLGASFPTRYGTPQSQQVLSDPEYQSSLNSQLAGIPSSFSPETQLVSGNSGFNSSAASPFLSQINAGNKGAFTSDFGSDAGTGSVWDQAQNLGVVVSKDANGNNVLGNSAYGPSSQGGSQMVSGGPSIANPAYAAAQAEIARLTAAHTANGISQQQAYNGMLGNGQQNGVMGDNYSTPGFGQVTGSAANPYSIAGTGVAGDPSYSSGIYDPSKANQSGVYNPASASKTFWGL